MAGMRERWWAGWSRCGNGEKCIWHWYLNYARLDPVDRRFIEEIEREELPRGLCGEKPACARGPYFRGGGGSLGNPVKLRVSLTNLSSEQAMHKILCTASPAFSMTCEETLSGGYMRGFTRPQCPDRWQVHNPGGITFSARQGFPETAPPLDRGTNVRMAQSLAANEQRL